MATIFQADACWIQGVLKRGAALCVDDEGRVLAKAPQGSKVVPLPNKVLLPGFVNAHSHAFQRILRGRTEGSARGDDFWTWREGMLHAAARLSPEDVYAISKQAFLEMALSGVTTVGEFHYLHHQEDGTPWPDANELALRVVAAARDVGLRVVLLRVIYARSGYRQETDLRRRRFQDSSVEESLLRTADLEARIRSDPLVSVGLAPHSVRAVPRPWLVAIQRQWRRGPLHMHVAEQPGEVTACLEEYQRRPVELLDEIGLLSKDFTAVHAIHLLPDEIQRLSDALAFVCACPSTERNLGDGIIAADDLLAAGVRICVGSDSQAHIDLLDEGRQLEGHLRLLRQRRNVLARESDSFQDLGRRLLECLTVSGARSLGVPAGTLAPEEAADFITIDLNHPSLVGAPERLETSLAFAASSAAVCDVVVGGHFIVQNGCHPAQHATATAFTACAHRIMGL